ncbi:MAG: hypothetical protein IPJ74_09395 [Saprospiraceae bacterium]|nr:hypothetical protein [Saprospiraceae bacterium]
MDYFAATLRAKTYFSPNEEGLLREIKESYFYTLTEQLQDEQAIQIGDHILMVRQNWNGKEDKPKVQSSILGYTMFMLAIMANLLLNC